MKGNQLDLTTGGPRPTDGDDDVAASERPFLGVKFDCCGVYSRVYLNRAGDAYEGRCPRCVRSIRFGVGPGGSSSRFFSAS